MPSRIDFEREAEREARRHETEREAHHRESSTMQDTTTTPSTPMFPHKQSRKSSKCLGLFKKSPQPASNPTISRIRCGTRSLSIDLSYERRDDDLTLRSVYPPATATPVPSPICNVGNGIAISPDSNLPMMPPPVNAQGSTTQFAATNSFPLQTQPQSNIGTSPCYIQSPAHPIAQSTSVPYQGPLPIRYSHTEAMKCEEHYNAVMRNTAQEVNKHEDKHRNRKKKTRGFKEDISKHIQHVHICAECGKKRSKKYQKAHPLKKGQVPDRSYCTKCRRRVPFVESDDTDDSAIKVSDDETHTT
jgi:hypothetical protein